jgi:peptide/nickel transport system substrate-binding protein
MGAYAPAHYLKQFHAKYASKDDLDKRIKEAGVDNWVLLLKQKMAWQLNPDLPVLTPWKTTTPNNKPTWVLERNPHYWAVDADGNQLPYVDKITLTQAETLEVLNLRAIAGEYDEQERHTDLGKLPVFLDNRSKGGYDVHLDTAANGSDTVLQVNQTYDADPEIAKWLTNRDFRRALSLGIDRDQLNEAFWLGAGTPGSIVPAESSPYNPGPEYRKLWSTYDPKKANDMLDQIGLDKKDAQGMRLRTDGKGLLRLEVWTAAAAFVPFTQHAEMIREHWKKIGVAANVTEMERSLAAKRVSSNEHHIYLWSNGGSELIYLFPQHAIPVIPGDASYMAPLTATWYASGGQQGKKPTDPQMLKALDLFRSASGLKDEERIKTARDIWKILVEEQWSIGVVGLSPAFMGVRVVSSKMGNIPARQMNAQHCRTPGSSHPATFYFKS